MRKFNIIAIATAALALASVGSAMATEVAVFGVIGGNTFAWNGSTDSLTITGSGNAFSSEAQPYFSGVVGPVSTSVTFTGATLSTTATTATETLGAGTFTITTGSGVISGNIAAGDSFTVTTSGASGLQFNAPQGSVTYNSTPLFLASGLSTLDGNLTPEANNFSPTPFTVSGGSVASFSGTDGITLDANVTSTPEPASIATFGIGAMALMLMGFVARRRNAGATL